MTALKANNSAKEFALRAAINTECDAKKRDTLMNVYLARAGVPVPMQPDVKAEWVRRLSRDRKV